MLPAALPILLLLGSLLAVSTYDSTVLPKQLHCSTTLYLKNKDNQILADVQPNQDSSDPADASSNRPVNLYQVEEYVDLDARRSSISVVDVVLDRPQIYYYQAGPDEQIHRSFILYDPLTKQCSDGQINNWPLASLANIAFNLHDSVVDMKPEHVAVSKGPSRLLYGIEDSLGSFVFKSRIFSKSKQTSVDVFERRLKYKIYKGSETVDIIVHLMAHGRAEPKEGETLEEVYKKGVGLDIALVGACKTASFDDLDSVEPRSKAEKNAKDGVRDSDRYKHPIDIQLNEDTFCPREHLVFTIHYHIVSLYRQGTLLGKGLDDFGQDNGHNFQLEPFAMPVGIGCLADDSLMKPDWHKRLSDGDSTNKLSAEYVSLYGEPGASYVAYDYQRFLIRLDEAGRKNIYDFAASQSYHIGEFSATASDRAVGREDGSGTGAGRNDDRQVAQCVVFKMREGNLPVKRTVHMNHQVIGLGLDDSEQYLGSRTLDHVSYEVFEKEWTDKSKLPLVLRSSKFPGLMPAANKRLFFTYYARAESTSGQSGAGAGHPDEPTDQPDDQLNGQPPLLSFIEVWELDTVHKTRRLINRVKFLEFSWQLDIEPADDPESQKPGPVDMRVFQVEPCHRDRAAQAELVLAFRLTGSHQVGATWLDQLRDNQYLVSHVDYYLKTAAGISILNLVDTKAQALKSGDIIASARIVELRSGISISNALGVLRYKPGDLAGSIAKVVLNRHSKDECRLESIREPDTSWSAYCPALATCLILKESEQLKAKLLDGVGARNLLDQLTQEESSSGDGVRWDTCAVESFKYKTIDVSQTRWDQDALDLAFKFYTQSKRGAFKHMIDLKSWTYEVEAVAFKQLDPIGIRLTNDASLLSGLRYTTKEEESFSLNRNVRVQAETRMGAFRFCQLACQMDDFCGSFSVCSRPLDDGKEMAYCVLSSVRLTVQRLNVIMSESKQRQREDRFEVKLTGETSSQVMMMRRDESCSLHSKDFLADYQLVKVWKNSPKQVVEEASFQGEETKLQKRFLDLADCAGLNFELEQFTNPGSATFTYCPLNSHCIVDSDDFDSHMADTSEYCYIYQRHATRVYNVQHMSHMVATELFSSTISRPKPTNTLPEKLDLLESKARSGNDEQLAKISWGLSEQKCARDCSRHKSKCLAFDACSQGDRVLCILYFRRSPLVKESARFPLLSQERDIATNYKVELHVDICDHYYLQDDYLEVRLNERATSDLETFELEEKMDSESGQQNNEILSSLIEDVNQLAKEDELANEHKGPSGNQLIHLLSLLIGVLLGSVGFVYKHHISRGVSGLHKIYKEKRSQGDDNLTDLVLTNQEFELQRPDN